MNDNPYQWEAAVDRSQNGRVLVSGPVVAGKPWPLRVTDNAAAEDLAARINGTNQPIYAVRADLLDGTNLIRHWLVGRTVDSVGLAAELRQWADTFQPTDLLRRKPQTVTVELPKDVVEQLAKYGDGWLGGRVGKTTEAACRKALGR